MSESEEDAERVARSDEWRYVVSGPSPYTVEAEIDMIGRFAAGARTHPGWRGVVARLLAYSLLAIIVGSMILGTFELLSG